MSTRDYAVSVLASLSEEKMLEFIKLFADENVLARMETDMLLNNSDTISAIQEVKELKNNYNRKTYSSFSEVAKELNKKQLQIEEIIKQKDAVCFFE